MKHAEKMILIPSEMVDQNKPMDHILNSFDNEMSRILNNRNMSPEVKLAKYNQVLRRFGHFQEQQHKPYELPIVDAKSLSIGSEEIIAGIPKTLQPNAKLLLDFIKNNPRIEIEHMGELVINGQKIHGSNIVDLIHDFTRERKSRNAPTGAKELAKVLKTSNVPLESISNKRRREVVGSLGQFDWVE